LQIQVTSVLRRQLRLGRSTIEQVSAAVADLVDLPVRIFPTAPLPARVWELRDNVSSSDACYVALAEALDVVLLTADVRLGNAPGSHCRVELI